MNQDKHLFQFSGKQIAEAAQAEADYHKSRLEYWKSEQEKIVEDARNLTATVKVHQQDVTGGRRYQIVADITGAQELNWKLNTAGSKIDTHRQQMDSYQLKANAYRTQETRSYELDPSDVAYFRLSGGERSEQ